MPWADFPRANDEANAARRATELQQYYNELLVSWKTWPDETAQLFQELMGPEINIDYLKQRRCQVARKIAADPELVRRAMMPRVVGRDRMVLKPHLVDELCLNARLIDERAEESGLVPTDSIVVHIDIAQAAHHLHLVF